MSDEVGQPLPTDEEDERPTSARDKKLLNVSPLTRTIAGRLRTARLTRSMTQQELVAGTTFSKGYISAIECGRVTPSLHTLAQLAERLEVSLAYLLGEVEQDLEPLKYDRDLLRLDSGTHPHDVPRAVQQRLIQVKACLLAGNWREAMQFLGEGDAPPNTMAQLPLVDWHWLTGWALLVQGRPRDALPRLQDGLNLAERLHARLPNARQARLAEGVVWLSHFLGSAWCALGQTSLAYDYHQRCREAIVAGTVTDPELKLLSYTGLGRDALVLGRLEESISAYKDAVRQAEELHAPRQRGLAYWGLGLAYQTKLG